MAILTLYDLRLLLAEIEKQQRGYPGGHSQLVEIDKQITRIKASIDYLESRQEGNNARS